jgi:galactose mutarotase-like enzyme
MLVAQSHWHNLDAWTLENDAMRAVIVPEQGAKIASIYDKRAGHEWLIRPTETPIRLAPYAAPYPDYDMNSWDEMFPTIVAVQYPVPGRYYGVSLPDHGEVWAMRWTTESADNSKVTLSVEGRALPYRLVRSATLEDPATLRLRYRATNTGSEAFAYLWTSHPLYAVDEQTEIMLPLRVNEVYNVHNVPPWGEHGKRYGWPHPQTSDGKLWDLSRIGPATLHDCRKFYVPPDVPVGWAGLRQRDTGAWLRMDWDKARQPYLGIWIDEGVYATVPTVALEPTNAFYDGLVVAYENNRVDFLEPGASADWELTVRLDDGREPINEARN